jgi:hypothetical protein
MVGVISGQSGLLQRVLTSGPVVSVSGIQPPLVTTDQYIRPPAAPGAIAHGVALAVGIPSLLDQLASLYLQAVDSTLSISLSRSFTETITTLKSEYEGLQGYHEHYQSSRFDRALRLINEAFTHFDLRAIRRQRRQRKEASPIPALLLKAADEVRIFSPERVTQIKQKLLGL